MKKIYENQDDEYILILFSNIKNEDESHNTTSTKNIKYIT